MWFHSRKMEQLLVNISWIQKAASIGHLKPTGLVVRNYPIFYKKSIMFYLPSRENWIYLIQAIFLFAKNQIEIIKIQ